MDSPTNLPPKPEVSSGQLIPCYDPPEPNQDSTPYYPAHGHLRTNDFQQYQHQPQQHSRRFPLSITMSSMNNRTCFNCGVVGHWAQECLEPKRVNPAGAMQKRPSKRQKTGPPIVTSHSPQYGQQYSQQYGPYDGTQPSPPVPPYYAQSQDSWELSTNAGSSRKYWQQQSMTPYRQNHCYQQNFFPPYGPNSSPAPNVSYPLNPPQNELCFLNQHQNHAQSYSQAPPYQMTQIQTTTAGYGSRQGSYSHSPSAQNGFHAPSQKASRNNSFNLSRSSFDQRVLIEALELEIGEIAQLNFTDFRTETDFLIRQLPIQVARPLSSTFHGVENLGVPSQADNDKSFSKYLQSEDLVKLETHVSATNDWVDFEDDPIFLKIPQDCPVISLSEILAIHKDDTQHDHVGYDGEISAGSEEGEYREESDDSASPATVGSAQASLLSEPQPMKQHSEHLNGTSETSEMDRTGGICTPQGNIMPVPQHTEDVEAQLSAETEAKLAALGVSGHAKPVHAPARPYRTSSTGSSGEQISIARSRSRSPISRDRSVSATCPNSEHGSPVNHYRERDYNCSSNVSGGRKRRRGFGAGQTRRPSHQANDFGMVPPPPPPPPPPPSTYSGDLVDVSASCESKHHNDQLKASNRDHNSYSPDHGGSHDYETTNLRKRPYEDSNRSPSDSPHKAKRGSAKATSAYSRRW